MYFRLRRFTGLGMRRFVISDLLVEFVCRQTTCKPAYWLTKPLALWNAQATNCRLLRMHWLLFVKCFHKLLWGRRLGCLGSWFGSSKIHWPDAQVQGLGTTTVWFAERGTCSRAAHSSTGISRGIPGISNIIRVSILRVSWLVCLVTTSGITVRIAGGRTPCGAGRRGRRWRGKGGLVVHQLGEHVWTVVRGSRGTAASLARRETETLASWMTLPSRSLHTIHGMNDNRLPTTMARIMFKFP